MSKGHFADRLFETAQAKKSRVVVGLDPRPELMPAYLVEGAVRRAGDPSAAIAGAIVDFNRTVIDAVADIAVAVKCQIAFYERYGPEGLKAYGSTIRLACESGLMVIGDVKRNDIGTTADAYAAAHLPGGAGDRGFDSDKFHVDAVTVNPLFGFDGIKPFTERAAGSGCGVFALVRTSNPSSGEIQELRCDGRPVYLHLASLVSKWGEQYTGTHGYSLLGAVAGATFPDQLGELRSAMPHTPLLIPGFGAQGGGVEDVMAGFDSRGSGAVVSASRSIIYAFRYEPYAARFGEAAYKDAVRAAASDMRNALWQKA